MVTKGKARKVGTMVAKTKKVGPMVTKSKESWTNGTVTKGMQNLTNGNQR